MSADFRLWGYIFEYLKLQAQSGANNIQHLAFQLALCYYVGFGTPIDEEEANLWLDKCHSTASLETLQKEVDFIKEDLNPMEYKNLETQIRPLEYLDYYQRSESLSDLHEVYESSMSNAERRLGETHPIPVFLGYVLGWVLYRKGEYKQSYERHAKTVRIREETLGPRHPDIVIAIDAQLTAARAGKMYDDINHLERKLLDAKRKRPKPEEDRSTVAGLERLKDGYLAQWRGWEADEAKEQLAEARVIEIKKTLGLDSVKDVDELWECWHSKRLERALELATKVSDETASCLGEEHPTALMAMDLLASIYEKLDDWEAVQRISERARVIREGSLGVEHPDTLRTRNNHIYACLYGKRSGYWSALQSLADAIEVECRVLGYNNGHTIYALNKMASELWSSTSDEEAEEMKDEALVKAERLDPEMWELKIGPSG